jgi:hypothetical protein
LVQIRPLVNRVVYIVSTKCSGVCLKWRIFGADTLIYAKLSGWFLSDEIPPEGRGGGRALLTRNR